MKTLFLCIALFLVSSICTSQEHDSTFHSLQKPLDLKKWTIKSYVISNPYVIKSKFPNFFTGIGVKRNFNFVSIRFSYENLLNKNEINYNNYHQLELLQEHTFRLGGAFKRRYFNVIDLNLYADFVVDKYDGETILDSNTNRILNQKFNGMAIGASIGIGFDYFITSRFSLEFETRVDILNNNIDYELSEYPNNTLDYFSNNYNILNLKLLGNLSINYHF